MRCAGSFTPVGCRKDGASGLVETWDAGEQAFNASTSPSKLAWMSLYPLENERRSWTSMAFNGFPFVSFLNWIIYEELSLCELLPPSFWEDNCSQEAGDSSFRAVRSGEPFRGPRHQQRRSHRASEWPLDSIGAEDFNEFFNMMRPDRLRREGSAASLKRTRSRSDYTTSSTRSGR